MLITKLEIGDVIKSKKNARDYVVIERDDYFVSVRELNTSTFKVIPRLIINSDYIYNAIESAINKGENAPLSPKEDRIAIIETITSRHPDVYVIQTADYIGLKTSINGNNFAELTKSKHKFSIRVCSKSLTPAQQYMCHIVPKSHGWALDAIYEVLAYSDIEICLELIERSFEYKSQNLTRGRRVGKCFNWKSETVST